MSETTGVGNLGSLVSSLGLERTSGTARATKADAGVETKSVRGDQATLSSAAGALAQAANTDDVRSEKVAELQKAIASGSYHVSSTVVADKLIDSMLK